MPKLGFRLRIEQESSVATVVAPGSDVGEEIEAEPDMLPVPPLSQGGDRTWGWIHLLGYWVAEAFGVGAV
jgi:NCS1 family nucleobase:cation symporter-1